MHTISKLALASLLGFALAGPTMANDAHHPAASASASTANAMPLTEGEIKKVDKSAGKLTIKHGELKNVGMPPMTMVFRVRDAAMLDQVRAGDKVRFAVERSGDAITVTRMETVK